MFALLAAFVLAPGLSATDDPFVAPAALREFARQFAPRRTDEKGRVDALVEAVFRSVEDGGLGVEYDNTYTRTVAEVWRDRKANCLSLTALCVAACESLGIHAAFAEVSGPGIWTRSGGLVRQERHVVALVHTTFVEDELVIDFNPRVRERLGRYSLSLLAPERARSLFHSNRAVELLGQRRLDDALAQTRLAVTMDPDLSVGWNAHGLALKAVGRLADAEKAYRRAIHCDDQDSTAPNNLEVLLRETGRIKEADSLRDATHKQRERNPYYQAFLAEEALQEAGLEEAMSRIKRAIKLQKREPRFHLVRARIHAARGEGKAATESLERARKMANGVERERYAVKLIQLQEQLAAAAARE